MIDKSEANQVKEDHLDILSGIIQKIVKAIKPKNHHEKITIKVGSSKVYQGDLGQEPTTNSISPLQVEKIQQALTSPQNLQGTVKITVGESTVFHASKGKVFKDNFGLTNQLSKNVSAAKTPENNTAVQSQENATTIKSPENTNTVQASEKVATVQSPENASAAQALSNNTVVQTPEKVVAVQAPTVESLQKQVFDLEERVNSQQKIIENLSSPTLANAQVNELRDLKQAVEQQSESIAQLKKGLEKIIIARLPNSINPQLSNWIGEVQSKVKEAGLNIRDRIKSAMIPKLTKLKNNIESQFSQLEQKLGQKIDRSVSNLSSQISEIRSQVQSHAENIKTNAQNIKSQVEQSVSDQVNKITAQAQTVHGEVTKMVESAHSKVTETAKQGISRAVNASSDFIMQASDRALSKSANALLKIYGEEQSDGSVSHMSEKYLFNKKDDVLTISRLSDQKEVLNSSGLTIDASPEDVQRLGRVQENVDKYNQLESESHQKQQSRGMSR